MIKLTGAAGSRGHDAHEYKMCKYSFVRVARTAPHVALQAPVRRPTHTYNSIKQYTT